MNLLIDPNTQIIYVLYKNDIIEFLYKVDNANPPMLSRVIEHGDFYGNQREKIVDEMSEFAKKEIEKLEDRF